MPAQKGARLSVSAFFGNAKIVSMPAGSDSSVPPAPLTLGTRGKQSHIVFPFLIEVLLCFYAASIHPQISAASGRNHGGFRQAGKRDFSAIRLAITVEPHTPWMNGGREGKRGMSTLSITFDGLKLTNPFINASGPPGT